MKKLLITLIGAVSISTSLTAIAGPDFQQIETARKAKIAKMQRASEQAQPASTADAPHKVVLPLDHGPRAQTTPWANQQRRLRAQEEARAKANAQSAPMPDSGK